MIDYSYLGVYSAIFYIYIQRHASKELGIDKRNIVFYALCILYILSTVSFIVDNTIFATEVSLDL